MDRLTKYQSIIENYLQEVADFYCPKDSPTIFDILSSYRNRHFQLVEFGHTTEEWRFTVIMHFHVEASGKIVLLANNTEQEPFGELIEAGIEEEDLYVGWVPPIIQAQLEKQPA
ncbi:MAG: element excision factor XisI family protein [Bacteroidota bacterium]